MVWGTAARFRVQSWRRKFRRDLSEKPVTMPRLDLGGEGGGSVSASGLRWRVPGTSTREPSGQILRTAESFESLIFGGLEAGGRDMAHGQAGPWGGLACARLPAPDAEAVRPPSGASHPPSASGEDELVSSWASRPWCCCESVGSCRSCIGADRPPAPRTGTKTRTDTHGPHREPGISH